MKLTSEEKQNLCQTARQAAKSAYAPYSRFRVGAAILGQKGIYIGSNKVGWVERAAFWKDNSLVFIRAKPNSKSVGVG